MSNVTDHKHWLNPEWSVGNLVKYFIKNNISIRTTESCTGGSIVGTITNVDGSSSIIDFSMVSYSPEVKQNIINVPEKLTKDETIVSKETSEAMNIGLKKLCETYFFPFVFSI